MEYNLLTDSVVVKTSNVVNLTEHFVLLKIDGTPLDLKVDIHADLEHIPFEYHEAFVNMLTAKYLNKISFGDNPFSRCYPVIKRRWWQFWKPNHHAIKLTAPEVAVTPKEIL
jgi:hypothetical protein